MGRSVREKSCHPKRSRLYWSWSAMRQWVYTHRIHKWGERHGPALAGEVWGAKFSETAVIPHSSLKRTPRVGPCSFSAIFFDLLHGNQKPLTVTKSCSLAFFGHFLRFSVRQTPPLYGHMESAPARSPSNLIGSCPCLFPAIFFDFLLCWSANGCPS